MKQGWPDRWERTRAKGMPRHVVSWALWWGGVMGVAVAWAVVWRQRQGATMTFGLPLTAILLGSAVVAAGAVLGVLNWYLCEWSYRRARRRRVGGSA